MSGATVTIRAGLMVGVRLDLGPIARSSSLSISEQSSATTTRGTLARGRAGLGEGGYFTQRRIVSEVCWPTVHGSAAPTGTVPQGVVPMRIEQ